MIVTDTGSQSNVIKYNIINLPKWDIAQSGVSKSDQGKKVFRLSHIWLPNPVFLKTSISTSTYTGANKQSVLETLRPTRAKYCTYTD